MEFIEEEMEVKLEPDTQEEEFTLTPTPDWKLDRNIERRVTVEGSMFRSSGHACHRDSEKNISTCSIEISDNYLELKHLVDELSQMLGRCEEKCGVCDDYILQLSRHVSQTHTGVDACLSARSKPKSPTIKQLYSMELISRNTLSECIPRTISDYSGAHNSGSISLGHAGTSTPAAVNSVQNEPSLNQTRKCQEGKCTQTEDVKSLTPLTIQLSNVLDQTHNFYAFEVNFKEEPIDIEYEEEPLLNSVDPLYCDDLKPVRSDVREGLDEKFPLPAVITRGEDITKTLTATYTEEYQMIDDEVYQCETCGKCFNLHSNLIKHHLTHTQKRRHKCEVCGKCFAQPAALRGHELTHTGEKPHKCETCGKCFALKTNLNKHKLIHIGLKSHVCEVCGKSFLRNNSLTRHKSIH